jgi:hypothetical protein
VFVPSGRVEFTTNAAACAELLNTHSAALSVLSRIVHLMRHHAVDIEISCPIVQTHLVSMRAMVCVHMSAPTALLMSL